MAKNYNMLAFDDLLLLIVLLTVLELVCNLAVFFSEGGFPGCH